ncbi:MAG: HD domain-containing protein [bacterium]|nr:HD domain-containing protein [bacterium]
MSGLSTQLLESILARGAIYEVGGAVRDKFMERRKVTKDHDYLVTGIPYDELTRILKKHGKADLVGKSFGVIKFTQFDGDEPVTSDFVLPRREFSTGSGHRDFKVDFDPDITVEEDLSRRDFTMNALAEELGTGKLIDPLGGQADIENGLIRIVYPESFHDDPLRMLRAIQFAARFQMEIERGTYQSICENAQLIETISPERILEELNKLLELSEKPSVGFRLMQETSLLKYVLPELEECVGVDQPGGYHKYNVFEHTMHIIDAVPPKLRLRLAALFHDINKPQAKRLVDGGATFYGHENLGSRTAVRVMHRLRYSNELIDQVALLVDRHMFTTQVSDKGMRRLMRRVGLELIFDLLDLRRADVVAQGMGGTTEDVDEFEQRIRDEIHRKPPLGLGDLAIDGRRVMELFSLQPGPEIGKILDFLMERVLDDPANNSAPILESLAKEFCETDSHKGSN